MSSKNAIQAATRAFSTIAVKSHNMAPKIVLNDFATRTLPGNLSTSHHNRQSDAARQPKNDIDKMFRLSEAPLDPSDFGYRVVAPVEENTHRYTCATTFITNERDNRCSTRSNLGRIIENGNLTGEDAAKEVLAAQREWDTILDAEQTRPHFEFWKEDPYNAIEKAIPHDLFAYVDSLEEDDFLEDDAA